MCHHAIGSMHRRRAGAHLPGSGNELDAFHTRSRMTLDVTCHVFVVIRDPARLGAARRAAAHRLGTIE